MIKLRHIILSVFVATLFFGVAEARYYDPQSGRFISEDPIGFQGGVNFYVYVLNNPVNYTDPLGLDTYMCKKPLDVSGSLGPYVGPNIPGSPFYHQYICVINEQGTQCFGQSSEGGKLYGEGAKSKDFFSQSGCEKVSTNKCIEACVINADSKQRPKYGVIGPRTNCQEWANETFDSCVRQCF